MKRIHIYLNYTRDKDLIYLMENPLIDFTKLSKKCVVSYFREGLLQMELPKRVDVCIEDKAKYDFYIRFLPSEEDVYDKIREIDKGLRGLVVKQIIRASIKGGLVDYFFGSTYKKNELTPQIKTKKKVIEEIVETPLNEISDKKEDIEKSAPLEEVIPDNSGIISTGDFDLFGELAALGAAPH